MMKPAAESDPASTALLLIGHGTRNIDGQARFRQTVEFVRQGVPTRNVESACLELCPPTIDEAVERLATSGVKRIVAVPLLLFAAGHAQRDIPAQLAAASQRFPGLEIVQAPHLGCHDAIVRLSQQRFLDAVKPVGQNVEACARETALLMVGRGSSDPGAIAEMHRFVELRVARLPAADVFTCFVAAAEPTLEQGLERMARSDVEQVVVQPHLLFPGDVLRTIRAAVDAARVRHPEKSWRIAQLLETDPLLVEAIVARAGEADPG